MATKMAQQKSLPSRGNDMNDKHKTKDQLIHELTQARQRITELEATESQLKDTEEALRENEHKYKLLVNSIIEGLLVIDADTMEIVFGNDSLARIYGFDSAEDALGTNPLDFIAPEDRERAITTVVQDMFQDDLHQINQFRTTTRDGRDIWISAVGTRTEYNGKPAGMISIRDITAQRRSEEARQEANDRYHALYSNPLLMIFINDEIGQFVDANDASLNRLGYTRDDITKLAFQDVVHPEDLMMTLQALNEVVSKGYSDYSVELRVITKSGEIVWISAFEVPLKTSEGHLMYMGIALDITERKHVEADFQESEERYRLLAENVSDVIWTTDMNLHYTYISPSITRLLGFSIDEMLNSPLNETMTSASSECVMSAFAEELAIESTQKKDSHKSRTLEIELYCKDGSTIWTEITTTLLRDEENHPIGILGITRDITGRRTAEEERREAERRYKAFFDNPLQMVYIGDTEGHFIDVNLAATQCLGYSYDEASKLSYEQIMHPDDISKAYGALAENLAIGQLTRPTELRLMTKSGDTVWVESVGATLYRDGEAYGTLGIAQNITERKLVEHALQESETKYRLLAENATDIIWMMDMNMRFTYLSPSVTHLVGYSVEELVGQTPALITTPSSFEEIARVFVEQLTIDESGQADLDRVTMLQSELYKKDGSTIWTEASMTYVRDEDNQPIGITGVTRDISERKIAEEKREEAERRYKAIFNNPLHIVYVYDNRGHFIDANDCALETFEYNREDISTLTFQEIIHPEDIPKAIELVSNMPAKGHMEQPTEIRVISKSGKATWVELLSLSLEHHDGHYRSIGIARDITERKQMEEALRESEERYRLLAENTSDVIFTMDMNLELTYISPSITYLLGDNVDNLMKRSLDQILTPTSFLDVMNTYMKERTLRELVQADPTRAITLELQAYHSNGSIIWAEVTVSGLRSDVANQPVGIIGVARDISERKQAEEGRKQAETRYRAIFGNKLLMVFINDAQGRFIEASEYGLQHTGYTKEDIGSLTFADIVHSDDIQMAFEVLGHVASGEDPPPLELRIISKSSEIIWISTVVIPFEESGTQYFMGIAEDITVRKNAEEALRESEQRFKEIFNSVSDEIIYVDTEGTVLNVNDRSQDIFGYNPQELVGRNVLDLDFFNPDQLQEIITIFMSANIENNTVQKLVEIEANHRDGHKVPLEVSTSPITSADGNLEGFVSIIRDITARKRAEAALHETEQRYRELFESSPEAITVIGLDGIIIDCNSQTEKLQGIPREQAIGQSAFGVGALYDEDVPRLIDLIARFVQGEEIGPAEVRIPGQGNETLWHEVYPSLIKRDGETHAIQIIMRDITERKRAEDALKESEERYRAVVNSAPDAIVVVGVDGVIKTCNIATEVITGHRIEELEGQSFESLPLLSSEGQSIAVKASEQIMFGQGLEYYEASFMRRDGTERWVGIKATILGSDEHIQGILVIARDITERKIAEDALRASEQRYRILVDSAPDAIVLIGADGIVNSCNSATEQMCGFTCEELEGHFFSDLPILDPEDMPLAATAFSHILHGQDIEDFPMKFKRRDGTIYWMDIKAKVLEADGVTTGTLILGRDITERMRIDAELRQRTKALELSNQELEQFAYVASHDLQEPLRMVASYVQLLARRYKGKLDRDADDFISYAVDGTNRMQKMINDLLAYSRVGTRGKDMHSTDCEVILHETLANLQVTLKENNARVTHDPLPTVIADSSQLSQLFQNLIGNAVKFHGEKRPHVHISAKQEEDHWVISVKDNGIGIDEQYHNRIFVIFQRLHARQVYSGTGIGLAICKKIVERHGGRIWVESQIGMGATFYFTIPIR